MEHCAILPPGRAGLYYRVSLFGKDFIYVYERRRSARSYRLVHPAGADAGQHPQCAPIRPLLGGSAQHGVRFRGLRVFTDGQLHPDGLRPRAFPLPWPFPSFRAGGSHHRYSAADDIPVVVHEIPIPGFSRAAAHSGLADAQPDRNGRADAAAFVYSPWLEKWAVPSSS